MKIYLIPNTLGRMGGLLKNNLAHLYKYVETEIDKSNFSSTFNELRLTLSYPPNDTISSMASLRNSFDSFYNALPYSRLNRKSGTIEITVKAPEFSEHFNDNNEKEYSHKFAIDPKYKNISEIELGRITIDKLLEAGEIIQRKIKKEDKFDFNIYQNLLLSIKDKINSNFLEQLHKSMNKIENDDTFNRVLNSRNIRQSENRLKDKLIRDFRVYSYGLPDKALHPFASIYSEIFRNLLVKERLLCPIYHHIYIQIALTKELAIKKSITYENWFEYGVSVINLDSFQTLSFTEKDKLVFNAIVEGIKDIATIDKLDIDILNRVITKISEKGIETELTFKIIENAKYKLEITYFAKAAVEEFPVYFNITDKGKNITKRHKIGEVSSLQIGLWLQKITLTNKQIRVVSSNSIRGQVWLKGKPTLLTFEIQELLI